MQTVINNYIVNSTIVGSAVVQGSNESTVNVGMPGGNQFAAEAFRIISALDIRRQVEALSYLYGLEGMATPPSSD